jgi:hypothetical protein
LLCDRCAEVGGLGSGDESFGSGGDGFVAVVSRIPPGGRGAGDADGLQVVFRVTHEMIVCERAVAGRYPLKANSYPYFEGKTHKAPNLRKQINAKSPAEPVMVEEWVGRIGGMSEMPKVIQCRK